MGTSEKREAPTKRELGGGAITTDDAKRLDELLSRLDYLNNDADLDVAWELLEALPRADDELAAARTDAVLWTFERRVSKRPARPK